MTTQLSFAGLSPRKISRTSLLLLLCAAPLTVFTQPPTSSTPNPAAVPTIAENLSVTPKFGQTQEQLAADRDECGRWAHAQTGFDPGQYGGGVAPPDYSARRQQYGRALAACLEGHGYNVRFAAPAIAPPSSNPPPPAAPPVVARYSPAPRPELKYHPFAVQIDGGYSVATGATSQDLDGGSNAGLGLSWFPTSALPIGIRVDGSYSWFRAKNALLNSGNFSSGHEDFYGGDADLQLNLAHPSSAAQLYLFGGIGWYREQAVLRQVSIVSGTVCGYFYCGPGYFPAVTDERRTTATGTRRGTPEWDWKSRSPIEHRSSWRRAIYELCPTAIRQSSCPLHWGFAFDQLIDIAPWQSLRAKSALERSPTRRRLVLIAA